MTKRENALLIIQNKGDCDYKIMPFECDDCMNGAICNEYIKDYEKVMYAEKYLKRSIKNSVAVKMLREDFDFKVKLIEIELGEAVSK